MEPDEESIVVDEGGGADLTRPRTVVYQCKTPMSM